MVTPSLKPLILSCVVLGLGCPAPEPCEGAGCDDAGVVDAGAPDAGVDAGEEEEDAGVPDGGEEDAGVDNGLADCGDPACAVEVLCQQDAGACARCGQPCRSQNDCLSENYHHDLPLAQCTHGVCTAREVVVRPRVATGLSGWVTPFGSIRSGLIRFIKKTSLDGGAVSCAEVAGVSSTVDAGAIERSGRFNVQGYDVRNVTATGSINGSLLFNEVHTQTGGDFLLWAELWNDDVDGLSWYPRGTRLGAGCVENPPGGALLATQDCDGGTCRQFSINVLED